MDGRDVVRERRRSVRLGGVEIVMEVARQSGGIAAHMVGPDGSVGPARVLVSSWRPGEPVWTGKVGGLEVAAQVRPVLNGVRVAWRGVTETARVMLPKTAEFDRLMPVKEPPDTSKMLLCPMPGLVVSVAVTEGQEVKAGETLAVVEAMKMENVLRAERDLTIAKINAEPGDSLAVDAVIMEFG
jgi:propionyl-CoA carboxylase alpha chain